MNTQGLVELAIMNKDDERSQDPPTNEQTAASINPATDTALWDKQALLRRVGNKPDRLAMLLQIFLDGLPEQRQALTSHLTNQEAVSAVKVAHSLKGSAANLSANQLMQAADQLEQHWRKLARQQEQQPDVDSKAEFTLAAELTTKTLQQLALVESVFVNHLTG